MRQQHGATVLKLQELDWCAGMEREISHNYSKIRLTLGSAQSVPESPVWLLWFPTSVAVTKFVIVCRLSQVPAVVFKLTLLRVLNMNNNTLSELPVTGGLDRLTWLDALDVSNNEIPQLPPELGLMTHLK